MADLRPLQTPFGKPCRTRLFLWLGQHEWQRTHCEFDEEPLENLRCRISDQTISNILRRRGLGPAPERRKETTWKQFIRAQQEVLAATDIYRAEVRVCFGLISYYVLLFVRLHGREVHVAGITPHPTEVWMEQVARNVTTGPSLLLLKCTPKYWDAQHSCPKSSPSGQQPWANTQRWSDAMPFAGVQAPESN